MARTGLTREQVLETAEALLLEGQTPTVVSIRSRLGGGSTVNITKWLGEWKAENDLRRVETLPSMPVAVEGAMRQVWGAAWKETQTQIEAEREALANLRKDIERERTEMLAEINRLDGELEKAKTEIDAFKAELAAERHAHEGTRADVKEARAIASERKARIEQQAAELQDAQRSAAEATAQAGRAQALVAERDRALADKDRLAADLKREQETARQAKAAIDAGAGKIRKLEEALEEERTARTEGERKLADLRVEVATLTERAARTDELRALVETLQHAQPQGRS
ncbi:MULTISPECIES: DNA-binding protein [unclassified Thiocapsa]|uniref:DNA-binding protein n=1 Tax=unclassified Thiocapsa TaxID=2641286 RepID=UPI0035AE3CAD